ncbi:hypothetical protein [Deinococcus sp. PEB2-63]
MTSLTLSDLPISIVKRILLSIDALNDADFLSLPLNANSFNLMRAVLMADMSIEISTAAVCEAASIDISPSNLSNQPKKGKNPTYYLTDYVRAIQERYSSAPNISSLSSKIDELHKNRNRVQHSGMAFDRDSTRIMHYNAKEYTNLIFSLVFGVGVDEIDISSTISNSATKQRLESALHNKNQGDYHQCALDLAIAMDIAKTSSRISGDHFLSNFIYQALNSGEIRPQIDHRVSHSISYIADVLQLQQLRMDMSEITFLFQHLPKIDRSPGSEIYFGVGTPKDITREEVEILFNLVTKAIWGIESIK